MAKAAKRAVKAKPKHKPAKKAKPAATKKRTSAKHLAESRRSSSKAQAFADSYGQAASSRHATVDQVTDAINRVATNFVSVDDLGKVYERLNRQGEDLARVRRFVGESTGSIVQTLPKIHTAVDRLCKDHASFRAAIEGHVVPLIGQVRELLAFRREAQQIILNQATAIRQLQARFDALDQLLRS